MALSSVLLALLLFAVTPSHAASPAAVGINYGQVANNLPTPDAVLPLLRTLGVGRVKLYDTDPRVLRAFANTSVEFIVGLPDRLVPKVVGSAAALAWVRANVQPHLPATKIVAVTIGNEVLTNNDTTMMQSLVPAMESVHNALASMGFDNVTVTTAHSLAILGKSYPPSAGAFRRDLIRYVSPLLDFHAKSGSPFLINAYPFFAYKADPKRVALDYVLFEPNAGVVDPSSGLRYSNMLHAQVDAVRAAISAAGGAKSVEVVVSETGWPSSGDADESGATAENAGRYNGNLMKMVADGKGTPMQPGSALHVFVFALFNENLKPGPASERHYGLFKPDGTPAYHLGIAASPGNSSVNDGGDGKPAHSPPQPSGAVSSSSYYTVSSTTERRWSWIPAVAAAGLLLLISVIA